VEDRAHRLCSRRCSEASGVSNPLANLVRTNTRPWPTEHKRTQCHFLTLCVCPVGKHYWKKNSPIPKSKSPIAKFWGNLPPGFSCLVQPPVHRSTVGSRAFWLLALRHGCLPPQLSATGGYVGTVPGDLSHSTKRRSWVTLSLTLGWSDIRVYTLFIVDLEGLKYLGHSKNSWLIDWNWSIEPLMAVFPNFFDLLPKIAPRRGSLPPITHEQQYFFSQKCPLFFGCTPN